MPSRSSGSPEAVNSRSSACTVLLRGEVGRDVGDVVAVVGRLGPAGVARLAGPSGAPAPRRPAWRSARRRRCSRTRASRASPACRAGCRSRRRARPGARGRRAAGRSGWPRRTRPSRGPAVRPAARPKPSPAAQHLGHDGLLAPRPCSRRLMKPGPAISIALDPALHGRLARAAPRPAPCASSRGFFFSGRPAASRRCRPGRRARPAWATRTPRPAPAPGLTSAIASPQRGEQRPAWLGSCGRFYVWPLRGGRAGAREDTTGCNRARSLPRRMRRFRAPDRGEPPQPAWNHAHAAGRAHVSNPRPAPTRRHRRPELPAQIGKYRVLRQLGEGATSEVFLCHDDFHDRDVAIKRVRAGALADAQRRPLLRALLRRRGRAGRPAAAPERGADLRRRGRPGRALPGDGVRAPAARCGRYCRADQLLSLELIVEIGFKCAMALGYVYRQGLIHRDVKPANLLAVLSNGSDHRRQDHRLRQRAQPRAPT